MMKTKLIPVLTLGLMIQACSPESTMKVNVFETSASGKNLEQVSAFEKTENHSSISVSTEVKRQEIIGFGGAFTESSAYNLNQLSPENRMEVLQAYFSKEGSAYSLTRTHMNSCDFSVSNYSYTPVEGDVNLEHFSIEEDRDDLIPMIKDAQNISEEGFKLFASPWSAAPWMKDNNEWRAGKLKEEYYPTWALFFSKYVDAYTAEGIDLWGFTVENEPHGNGGNWESMHYSPEEMTRFVNEHLGPQLEADGKGDLIILGYDQNRQGIQEWADVMYKDEESKKYYDGMAVHWYESTYDYFPEELEYAYNSAPDMLLLQTEACIDNQVPEWKNDHWYWEKEATDWGYYWREEANRHLHPKYAPVNRYARDIIGCLNHWVQGWVDWNMVLDRQGGPNWANNWCIAPVIVDTDNDEIYYTPMFYILQHFSKFIRPGANVVEATCSDEELMVAAVENTDGSLVVVVFNEGVQARSFDLEIGGEMTTISIEAQALQTIIKTPKSEA